MSEELIKEIEKLKVDYKILISKLGSGRTEEIEQIINGTKFFLRLIWEHDKKYFNFTNTNPNGQYFQQEYISPFKNQIDELQRLVSGLQDGTIDTQRGNAILFGDQYQRTQGIYGALKDVARKCLSTNDGYDNKILAAFILQSNENYFNNKVREFDNKIEDLKAREQGITVEFNKKIESIDKDWNVFLNEKRKEIEDLKNELKTDTQKQLAFEYSKFFEEKAEGSQDKKVKGYKQIYEGWKVSLISAFLIILPIMGGLEYLLNTFWISELPSQVDIGFYLISTRVSVFAILAYIIFICNRNYSNNRHLYNVYKQKALSLESYRIFMETVPNDEQIRKEVSLKIAQSIFEPIETGYIKQTETPSLIDTMITTFKK